MASQENRFYLHFDRYFHFFCIFFYFQNQTESEIKESIFEQQQKNQIDKTKSIAENVESALNLIMAKLGGIVAIRSFTAKAIFNLPTLVKSSKDRFEQINDVASIDRRFLFDKNGASKMNSGKNGLPSDFGQISPF